MDSGQRRTDANQETQPRARAVLVAFVIAAMALLCWALAESRGTAAAQGDVDATPSPPVQDDTGDRSTVPVPGGLTGTGGTRSITLDWNDVSGATAYEVQQWDGRSNGGRGSWRTLPFTETGIGSYTITFSGSGVVVSGLADGTGNVHRVRTRMGSQYSAYSGFMSTWTLSASGATVTSTATLTPTTTPTATPVCGVGSIGRLKRAVTRKNSWSSACESVHRSGSYARYYSFSMGAGSEVTIDLGSTEDTYLVLRSGSGKSGRVVAENDDIGNGNLNSRISRTLSAGTYTVEATTFEPATTGNFTLTIRPGGTATPTATPRRAQATPTPTSTATPTATATATATATPASACSVSSLGTVSGTTTREGRWASTCELYRVNCDDTLRAIRDWI